jgi:hypothetical protein
MVRSGMRVLLCSKYVEVAVYFKYPGRGYRSFYSFKKNYMFFRKLKFRIKFNNHYLMFKRSPKGFKLGKQRVSFFNCTFYKKFFIDDPFFLIECLNMASSEVVSFAQ